MYVDNNERRAFLRRKQSLFRKGYEFQKKFQARVYIVIERHGSYHVYRHSHRTSNWPPYHEAAEIRTAQTMFPTDFQTVRDADTRGPVSSDADDTATLRAPSHDEPVPSRSAEEDEAFHQDSDCRMDPYPDLSFSERAGGRHSSYMNNRAFPTSVDARDAQMSGIDGMEDRANSLNYQTDGGGTQGAVDEQGLQLSIHHSPAGSLSGQAAVDLGPPAADLGPPAADLGRPAADPSRLVRVGNARAPPHAGSQHVRAFNRNPLTEANLSRGEPLLAETHQVNHGRLHDRPGMGFTDVDRARDLERTASRASSRHGLANDAPSANLFSGEDMPPHPEGRSLQKFTTHGPANARSDAERVSRFSNLERPRHGLANRGPTPDRSPQRFPNSGIALHGLSPSSGRKLSSHSLSHLPRAPTRGFHRM